MNTYVRHLARGLVTTFVLALGLAASPAEATTDTFVDQSQPIIDASVGTLSIGGYWEQRLAQVFTAGAAGDLMEIRAPVACAPDATLALRIERADPSGAPSGEILATRAYPGTSYPWTYPAPPALRSLPLELPVPLEAGAKYAFILDADGPGVFDGCGAFQGPLGDPYPGGDLYYMARPSPWGSWTCQCVFAVSRRDLPFEVVLARRADATPPHVAARVTPEADANGWQRADVTVAWDVSDAESRIVSTEGCETTIVSADTPGLTFTCVATNAAGLVGRASVTVRRDAKPPTIAFIGNEGTYLVDQAVAISCRASDATSGLAAGADCGAWAGPAYGFGLGTTTLEASATDIAGNRATATAAFEVRVTYASLCRLIRASVSDAGLATSLCAKLDAAAASGDRPAAERLVVAFRDEVHAQRGVLLAPSIADLLDDLAAAL